MALEIFLSNLLIVIVSLLSTSASCAEDVDWTKCGESQVCIRSPPSCNPLSDCDLAAAFLNVSSDYIGFRLRARSKIPRSYVAITMSSEQNSTDNSTVIYCSPAPGDQIVRFGLKEFGILKFPSHEEDKRLSVIKRITYLPEDKLIICDFDRVITPVPETPFADPLTIPKYTVLSTGTITSKGLPTIPSLAYQTPEKISFEVNVNGPQGDVKVEEIPKEKAEKEEASEKEKREFKGNLEQGYAAVPISDKTMVVYKGDSGAEQHFEAVYDKRGYRGGYGRYPPEPAFRSRAGYDEYDGPPYGNDEYVPHRRPPPRYSSRPTYSRVHPEDEVEYEPPRTTARKTSNRREKEEEDEKTQKSNKEKKGEEEKESKGKGKKATEEDSASGDDGDSDGAMGQNIYQTAAVVILTLALL